MLLGLWLFVSPWALQYAAHEAAAWNAYVLGTAIVMFAAFAVYMREVWEEPINIGVGVWLVISPYALGFVSETTVAVNTVLVGALTVGFATWVMKKRGDYSA